MYLIPRLIGIGIYIVILFSIAYFIRYSASKKDIRILLNLYWITAGLIGFFFVPPIGFDLPRLIERMQYYAEISNEIFIERTLSSLTPGEFLFYRIIGNLPNAEHVLPCISALISFGFCFAVLKDLIKTREDRVAIFVALVLFMSRGSLMTAIDTVRAYMAMSITAWCVYQELCNKKSFAKHLPLYIIACSMHAMGYVLLLIRVAHMLYGFQKSLAQKVAIWILAIVSIGYSAIALSNVWQMLLEKMEYYYEVGQNGEGYFYIWEGVLSGMSVLVAIYLLVYLFRHSRMPGFTTDPTEVDYCNYMMLIVLITFISVFVEFNFFMRMGHYIMILVMPLTVFALRLAQRQNDTRLKQNLICIAIVMLLLACARGYLCSLKFFE